MRTTKRVTVDAWTNESRPNTNYNDTPGLKMNGGATVKRAYIHTTLPKTDPDTEIVEYKLRVFARGAMSGSFDLIAEAIVGRWYEGRIKHGNAPAIDTGFSVTESVSSVADGEMIEFDLTAMAIHYRDSNLPFYGVRIRKSTSGDAIIHSSDSGKANKKPYVIQDISSTPDAANRLSPTGNAVISLTHPELSWHFRDPDGENEQGQFWVILATSPTVDSNGKLTTGIIHDSGWVVSSRQSLDLALTAFGGLANGDATVPYYWQVKGRDSEGLEAPWSPVSVFYRASKGALTISAPVGATVGETNPTFTVVLTGQAMAMLGWELRKGGARGEVVASQPMLPEVAASGVGVDVEIPKGYVRVSGQDYTFIPFVRDGFARVDRPGDKATQTTSKTVTYLRAGGPAPTTDLVAAMDGARLQLSFDRATAPGGFALVRDGEIVQDDIDPVDVSLGGTDYRIETYDYFPGVEHTWEVEAVEDIAGVEEHSDGNATVDYTASISGVWVVSDESGLECPIFGPTQFSTKVGRTATVHKRLGQRRKVEKVDAIHGNEGTISGQLIDGKSGLSLPTQIDRWETLIELVHTETFRILYEQRNYRCEIVGEPLLGPTQVPEIWAIAIDHFQINDWTVNPEELEIA